MGGTQRVSRPALDAQVRVILVTFWSVALIGALGWAFDVGFALRGGLLPAAIAACLALSAWVLVSPSATGRFVHVLVTSTVLMGNALVLCVEDPALRAAAAGWNVLVAMVFAPVVQRRALAVYVVLCAAIAAGLVLGVQGPLLLRLLRALAVVGLVLLPLAQMLALRAHLDGLLRTVREQALRDSLTGLLNRRGLHERFGALWSSAHRQQRGVAVISLDLDHFKRVNDTFGHAAGDAALSAAAQALVRATRGADLVVRLGGEELLVVLLTSGTDEAVATAERLRRAVALECAPWSLTASVGVAVRAVAGGPPRPAGAADDDRARALLDELLRGADRCLYRAKAEGRDRVVCCG